MGRTRIALLILLLVFIAIPVIVSHRLRANAKPRITREVAGQITKGMTRAEVHDFIGWPPGEYASGPTITGGGSLFLYMDSDVWISDDCELIVQYDANDVVDGLLIRDVIVIRQTPIRDTVRR